MITAHAIRDLMRSHAGYPVDARLCGRRFVGLGHFIAEDWAILGRADAERRFFAKGTPRRVDVSDEIAARSFIGVRHVVDLIDDAPCGCRYDGGRKRNARLRRAAKRFVVEPGSELIAVPDAEPQGDDPIIGQEAARILIQSGAAILAGSDRETVNLAVNGIVWGVCMPRVHNGGCSCSNRWP
ncbi:MAG: hypothetical protein KC503_17500 [Myxococcales bacterium]|nr:hypothetical protein [Myxococcales bacterium]